MAIYKFTEVDNTKLSTVTNDETNYVYIPINSTWGPTDAPVPITSLAQLKEVFGDDAEEGTSSKYLSSYKYAQDILRSGLCVLVKRLGGINSETAKLTQATQKEFKKVDLKYKTDDNRHCVVTVGTEQKRGFGERGVTFTRVTGTNNFTYDEPLINDIDVSSYVIEEVAGQTKDDFKLSATEKQSGESKITEWVLTYIKTETTTLPETLNVKAEYYTRAHDAMEALHGGTYGNNLVSSFSLQNYGASTKLLVLTTVDAVTGYTLEQTPLGKITITDDISSDKFVPVNTIQSEYIEITKNKISVDLKQGNEGEENVKITFVDGADITRDQAIDDITNAFSTTDAALTDKWSYEMKFICNGGLVSDSNESTDASKVANAMIALAAERGDCVAFVDHKPQTTSSTDVEDFADGLTKNAFGALYSPWCYGTSMSGTDTLDIPASYYAITNIGKSYLSGNNICQVPAGVSRGSVNIKRPMFEIGGKTMEKWQGETGDLAYCINPIMNVRNYGYCIFGQRNLVTVPYGSSTAMQELGVRFTLNEIKKWIRDVSISLTFETNTNRTWNEFVARSQKCLDKLVSDGLLTGYEIDQDTDGTTANTLKAIVRVYVTRSLERFDITVEVNSGTVTFDETTAE